LKIVERFVDERIHAAAGSDKKNVFLSPYYGWAIERLLHAIRPDTSQGEAPEIPRYESARGPGSTGEVDFWTTRDVCEVIHSHLNYVVADTAKWEQSAAYFIDNHPAVAAFAKNAGLGFAIPYFHNGQMHDYVPDFVVRLKSDPPTNLILETKGYDELEGIKRAAAERWVNAVNAEGSHGHWAYRLAKKPGDVPAKIDEAMQIGA
jgi:type III restriction enzyme